MTQTARERAAAHLITNGRTAMHVFHYLHRHQTGSALEIARALGASRSAARNALSRLRGAGVACVVSREATTATAGSPAAIWGLEEAYADFKPSVCEREAPAEESRPIFGTTIVQRALAAQPPLATVWMEVRA